MKVKTVKVIVLLFFVCSVSRVPAQNIDIIKYNIQLDISNFQDQVIQGSCMVQMKAFGARKTQHLDLLGLQVDSVIYQGNSLTFSHIDEDLAITWPVVWPDGEERTFTVYYGGKPKRDAQWGGFYFSGDYAFNLGVGFAADPHNYGRVWFPCNDTFTDRSVFEFKIITDKNKKALCNGSLKSETDLAGDKKEYHWVLRDPIPTYLASVAVAPYHLKEYTHLSIPVILAAVEADTAKMYSSFENLPHCISTFINRYGAHTFERIGFNLVPFNGGAMEHATNIAYPRFGAAGNKNYETLWAHELAHHWWGNTVTCATQEDMWINEGWASYSERLFLEAMYGKDAYKKEVSDNHRSVLHIAHLRDGDTLPVSGIGHANTYGSHVYDKGAEVAHTLRGYMGDDSFFAAIQEVMVAYKFQSINSAQLETIFQKHTSHDLSLFFKHWVYNPGFPHFDIISQSVSTKGDSFANTLTIRQRTRMAPEFFDAVSMEVTFYDKDLSSETKTVVLSNEFKKDYEFTTSFKPLFIALDVEEKISDAITDKQLHIDQKGEFDFEDALMVVNVDSIDGNALVRVEHNWVSPDHYFNPNRTPVLSKERYWTVGGIWPETFVASATIEYNGSTPGSSYSAGYLDQGLIRITEDSLVLMYRENASMQWRIYPDYDKTTRTVFDKKGTITINNLKRGEYAFAMYNVQLLSAKKEAIAPSNILKAYPSPAEGIISFKWESQIEGVLEITDRRGVVVDRISIHKNQNELKLDLSKYSKGIYYAGIVEGGKPYQLKAFYVR